MEIFTWRSLALAVAVSAFPALAQQHGYTPGDIDEGGKLYRANCIGCHGPEGASVTGIDLGRARFRRVSTDEEIADVILKGVPGTGMPGGLVTTAFRAYMIVAYMRTMGEDLGVKSIAAAKGDVARGKALFAAQACNTCHAAYGVGGRSGPDLTEAGLTLRPIEIETSILDPDKDASATTRPFRVVRKDGTTVTGALLNQDTHTVQILDANGRPASFAKADLRESGFVAKSPMPGYRGKVNAQELADLIAYVTSLKGTVK